MSLAPPTPYQWQVGDVGSASLLNAQLFNGLTFLLGKPVGQLATTTTQSIPNSAFTGVQFNSSSLDNYAGHSNVTNNSRYTAQVAGTYILSGALIFAANATGFRELTWYRNGIELTNARSVWPNPSGATSGSLYLPAFPVSAVIGDYFEMFAFQNSGGALATAGPSTGGTYFNVTLL